MYTKLKNKGLKKFYALLAPSGGTRIDVAFISKQTYERLKDQEPTCAVCLYAEKKEDIDFYEVIKNIHESYDYKARDEQDLPTFMNVHYVEFFEKDGYLNPRPISKDTFDALCEMNRAVFCVAARRFSEIDLISLVEKSKILKCSYAEE